MKKTKQAKKPITKDMTFSSLIHKKPDAAAVLFEKGMMCVGCAAATNETIEQGCKAHGMNDGEIKKLIEELNKK